MLRTSVPAAVAAAGVVLICSGLETPSALDAAPGAVLAAPGPVSSPVPAFRPTLQPTPAPERPEPERPVSERPGPGPRTPPTDQPDVRDEVTGPVLPESDPVTVSIPGIGVRSELVELGLQADGTMEVPRDPARAGWFSRGAAPGALGPAVIAGHVTWNGSPGVFFRLGTLRRGDRVAVTREDHKVAVFRVDRVERFSKSRFPTRTVYGAIDHAGLRLITCGGSYDEAERRYLDNVVVFATLEAVRVPRHG